MTHERSQIEKSWIEGMFRLLLGDENITAIKNAYNCPSVPFHQGDTYLHEKLDEVEQFFFSLLPTPGNRITGDILTIEMITNLIDVFWVFIRARHKIFGPIGVRVGWELVIPSLKEDDQPLILKGKFEMKGNESLIN